MKLLLIQLLIFTISYVSCELDKNTSIIIIGAGPAGISALSKLLENNYTNVVLLEASDRIGGRINTVPFASNVVDMGAQWVHGQKGNIIYEMVKDHKVLDITKFTDFVGWLISSESERPNDYMELNEISQNIMYSGEIEIEGCENKTVQPMSFGDHFLKLYKEELEKPENKHISKNNSNDFVRYIEKMFNFGDAGDSWFETSLCSEYERLEGENNQNWKDNGFKTVFDFITKKLPDPSKDLKVEEKIQFKKEVTKIEWSEDADKNVIVNCADNSKFEAQHVIVTVPLGVLKAAHKTMFSPSLPANKVKSIEAIPFGTLNKIFLEFEKPFWPKDWLGFNLIWTEKGLADLENLKKHNWTKGLFGFWTVPYQPNILSGWTVGPDARAMETLKNDEILEGVMYVFKEFLNDRINYTKPKTVLPSRWSSNPFSFGSYSSRSIETDRKNASPFDLSLPLNNSLDRPVVLFAGEATHPKYHSATHGAVESGYREAEKLMNLRSSASRLESIKALILTIFIGLGLCKYVF